MVLLVPVCLGAGSSCCFVFVGLLVVLWILLLGGFWSLGVADAC